MTREERRRMQRRTMQLLTGLCFLALAALVLLAALTTPVESSEPPFLITEPALPEPEPVQEDFENEKIEAALLARAHKIENVTVSHYDICRRCCGNTRGITASGRKATPYVTVAVDPAMIPLGADVLVDYGDGVICYYRADDTGSGVAGGHIDLCVGSHREALQLGLRTATVYWIEED